MPAQPHDATGLALAPWRPGAVEEMAASGGVAVTDLLDMVRRTCAMVRYVDSGRDAATLVRRARGLELLVRTALKDCTILEEEQFELRQEAAEAHVRTQRRAGELLSELQKHRGGRPPRAASHVEDDGEPPLTLRELGIDGHESHRWQRIASVPEAIFERYIETCRSRRTEITTANVLALARQLQQEEQEELGSGDARPSSNAALLREYQELRRYASNVIWLDPTGLAESMAAPQRVEALSELERLLLWLAEFRDALHSRPRLTLPR